jgi:hypothetical protein
VVDMAHHRDDRRARFELVFGIGLAAQSDLHIRLSDTAGAVAELADHQFGGVGVDHLIDRRHHAHLHQGPDHIGAAFSHAVRQLRDGDGLGDHHIAGNLGLLDLAVQTHALALAGATHRRDAARALILVGQRAGDCQLAGAATGFVAPDGHSGTS